MSGIAQYERKHIPLPEQSGGEIKAQGLREAKAAAAAHAERMAELYQRAGDDQEACNEASQHDANIRTALSLGMGRPRIDPKQAAADWAKERAAIARQDVLDLQPWADRVGVRITGAVHYPADGGPACSTLAVESKLNPEASLQPRCVDRSFVKGLEEMLFELAMLSPHARSSFLIGSRPGRGCE